MLGGNLELVVVVVINNGALLAWGNVRGGCGRLVLLLELLALGLLIGIEASLVMVRLVHGGRVVNRRELLGTLVEEGVHDVG